MRRCPSSVVVSAARGLVAARPPALALSAAVAVPRRGVFDADGYELPFGQSKADRMRSKQEAAQKAAGVTIVLPTAYRMRQWSPAHDGDAALAVEDAEHLFTGFAEHSVELRRARMANMRLLLEGVPLRPEAPDKFNDYFRIRDGEIKPPGPLLTLEEVEMMLQELTEMRFPDEDEEMLHVAGSLLDDEELKPAPEMEGFFSVAAARRYREAARTLTSKMIGERTTGMRAPYVSDEVERKLLVSVCLQVLTQRLTEAPAAAAAGGNVDVDPATGRRRVVESAEAREHPVMYVRYGHEESGTGKAFEVLEHILEVDAEQQYEAVRYHAELALMSGQLWKLADTMRLCKGDPASPRDAEYRESCCQVCEEIVAVAISDFLMKGAMLNTVEGGEGTAAKEFLRQLTDICTVLGSHGSQILIETIADNIDGALSGLADGGGEANVFAEELKRQGVGAPRQRTTVLQACTAMLKTLVGTELPLVVDANGVLMFSCFAKLYGLLKMQSRMHESWGISEDMLRFYDEYAGLLAADFEAQRRLFAEQLRELAGVDVAAAAAAKGNEGSPGALRVVQEEKGLPALYVAAEAATRHNPYQQQMRQIHLDYLNGRCLESAIWAKPRIERAIRERYRDSGAAWRLLSMACFKLGQVEDAVATARHAMVLEPRDPSVHVMLASFHWHKEEFLMARREMRLAELVESAVKEGRDITAADLELAVAALDLLDERRAAVERETEDALKEDSWSHKFFNARRRDELEALVAPEVDAGTAVLPPMTSELVRELSRVQDDPGDDDVREWIAHMSWANRYSSAISRPRAAKRDVDRMDDRGDDLVELRTTLVNDDIYIKKDPPVY